MDSCRLQRHIQDLAIAPNTPICTHMHTHYSLLWTYMEINRLAPRVASMPHNICEKNKISLQDIFCFLFNAQKNGVSPALLISEMVLYLERTLKSLLSENLEVCLQYN